MSRLLTALAAALVGAGCGPAAQAPPQPNPPGAVFRSTGSIFRAGPLEARQLDLAPGEAGVPVAVRLHAPVVAGTYPVVVFQHGFLSDRRGYDEILGHLATHGFVVAAPQMYPADGVFLGKPTAAAEAREARRFADWAQTYAATVAGAAADPRPLGLAGHSRGGKVAWLMLLAEGLEARALVGVDPVDGRGGPLFGAQPEALPRTIDQGAPTLILGMELGGSCAPAADGYRHFFERSSPPLLLVAVTGHGHADMLDADLAEANSLCPSGPNLAGVRTLTGGLLAGWFRLHLQDDASVSAELETPGATPVEVTYERR